VSRVDELTEAVAALNVRPRTWVWTSLTWCVLDAVWSINSDYRSVVVPAVRRVASTFGDDEPLVHADAAHVADPVPLTEFLGKYGDEETLVAVTTRHRTSPRGGITKAAAAISYARILSAADVNTREDASQLLGSVGRLADVDRSLGEVAGEGGGVRRAYLWMLVGSDDRIKPDRMVVRFLARYGVTGTPATALAVMGEVAARLSTTDRPVTPWMVDHAIWEHERRRGKPL
jgi:hypothetical protein